MDWIKKNWPFLIGLCLTASLLWPLFISPFFTHHDDVTVIRLYEMDKCFKDNQIPCRWVPDLGNLYGYPLFNYYAPLPYYFGELVYLITKSLMVSVKVMFAFSFIGAFVFMYLLASKLWGKIGGSLAAIFYSFAPYHALDFYVRGAMGEMWALMFFPLLFWATLRLREKLNILNLLIFGTGLAGLLTSHNLSAMVFIPILIIWIIFAFWGRICFKALGYLFAAFILGIILSSFYLLPMLVEKNFVHVDSTTWGYFSYTEHFKGFKKLFLERSWGYGSSIREVPGGAKDSISYQIGWIHLLGWLLALVSAKVLWKQNKHAGVMIIFFSALSLFAIFMVNPRSELIWRAIEPLKYLQFPWRLLIVTTFLVSLVSGSVFKINFHHKKLIWGLLVAAVVIFNFSYFKPEKFIYLYEKELLQGKNWDRQINRAIFDFLPIYAKEPPGVLAQKRYQILTGDSKILDFKEGTNWISFKTETLSHTIIRLSQYYFPNWKVFVDGKETKIEYKNNSLGLMTFILGKGNHDIKARLYDTPIRSFANLITLVGIVISVILFLVSFGGIRKWISYYKKRMN